MVQSWKTQPSLLHEMVLFSVVEPRAYLHSLTIFVTAPALILLLAAIISLDKPWSHFALIAYLSYPSLLIKYRIKSSENFIRHVRQMPRQVRQIYSQVGRQIGQKGPMSVFRVSVCKFYFVFC